MLDEKDFKAQLRRVLAAVEQLLPQPVEVIDWQTCYDTNLRVSTIRSML